MKLFLDTEFTIFNGELISMGIVSENDDEFYEVLPYNPQQCHPWVRENVLPILDKDPITYIQFQQSLVKFLNKFDNVELVVDWPEDAVHFFKSLMTGPGTMYPMKNVSLVLDMTLNYKSEVPHNALSDARAIKESYFKKYEANV